MASSDSFQHFRILQRPDGSPWELGRGAMGVTYKAFDTNLRYDVALKVINTQLITNDSIKQRFIREARSAAQLSHPNVARVFHLGEADAGFFYAMEYVDGETVEHRVQSTGPIRLDLALRIVRQVTRALIAAERQRLVHRDIKPSNIMLVSSEDLEHIQVKVIDFGLAKSIVGADLSGALTVCGFVGTPHFASPEQLKEQNVDLRSDIYSLGATLWFMIVGQPPFQGAIAEVIYNHMAVPPSEEVLGQIPEPVSNLLRKMLAKSPSDRFQSPLELSQRLDDLLKDVEPIAATASFVPPKTVQVFDKPDSIFSPGQVLAGHYEVHQRWSADTSVFQAIDLRTGEMVAIRLLLSPVGQSEAELISAWRTIHHPNLIEIRGVESMGQQLVVISEWIHGFTLLELLRVRRELAWPEVQVLVRPFASALDYLTDRQELKGIIKLRKTFVVFPPTVSELETIQHSVLGSWPGYTMKADTLDLCTDLQTAEPAETLVEGSNLVFCDHPVRQLASVLYELLGGVPNPSGSGAGSLRFAPLPKLTENGNTVLRRALFDPSYFPSAVDFFSELERFNRPSFESAAAIKYVVEPTPGTPNSSATLPDIPLPPSGSLLPIETPGDDRLAARLDRTSLVKHRPRPWTWIAGTVGTALFAVMGYQAYQHFLPGLDSRHARPLQSPTPSSPINLTKGFGTLKLASRPGGLTFHLVNPDQKTISGTTPATIDQLSAGKYRVTLSRPGWPDYSQTVDVSANHLTEITHDFSGNYLPFSVPSTAKTSSMPPGTPPPQLASGPGNSAVIPPAATPIVTPAPVQASSTSSPSPLPPIEARTARVESTIPAATPTPLTSPLPEIKLEPIAPPEPSLTPAAPPTPAPAATATALNPPSQSSTPAPAATPPAVNPPALPTTSPTVTPPQPGGISTVSASPTPDPAAPLKRQAETALGPPPLHANASPYPKPRSASATARQPSVWQRQAYARPAPSPQATPDLQRERAKVQAFRLFGTEWAAKQSALKAEKQDIDYQLRNSTGRMRDQWKQRLSQWKQERAQAERDHAAARSQLKKEWQ